jgi:hypothetical protein
MAKVRSPNYPAISLADAIPKIRAVHEKEFNHPATREVIAKAMGYGGLNGASSTVISALSKYGLLEPAGNERYRVSANAVDIILHKKGDSERAAAIERCAFSPPLFEELRGAYPNSLPSDENLRVYLIKKGFNPKSVGDVIRAYRDTIELVTEETKNYSAKALAGAKPQERQCVQEFTSVSSEQSRDHVRSVELDRDHSPGKGVYEHSFPLSYRRDVRAVLTIYGENLKSRDLVYLKKKINDLFDEELIKDFEESELESIREQPVHDATWRNKDHDQPVKVTGEAGTGPDGRRYLKIEGSDTGVPEDEVTFKRAS